MQTSAEATGFQANADSFEARVSANNELEVLGAAGRDIYVCSGGLLIEIPVGADEEFTGSMLFLQEDGEPKLVGFFRVDVFGDRLAVHIFDRQYLSDSDYTRMFIRSAIISVIGETSKFEFNWYQQQGAQ